LPGLLSEFIRRRKWDCNRNLQFYRIVKFAF
jgi:hypothetical protein